MYHKRIIGSVTAVAALTAAVVLYTAHPVKSSDHQDTFNLATRGGAAATSAGHSADITDVFVFPAPDNANNVVFAMDVSPLIMPGQGTSAFFDPTLLWQFKIAHGASNYQEDQVIQFHASGTGATQTMSLYGPAAPSNVGTTNKLLSTATGSATYNQAAQLQNGTIQLFAGPRTDPFFFDLFAFFQFLGDRNYGTHTSQSDPGPEPQGPFFNGNSAANIAPLTTAAQKAWPATTPSFNGFAPGSVSGNASGNYACSTSPAADTLFLGPFNVLSLVVEVPKSLITGSPYNTSTIHVWATVSSPSGS